MAYTSGIFFMDFALGSDAARSALTPTAYANNGSGLVRITISVGTTPVTNAIIDITGTTGAVYDGSWKVTNINSTTFDLQSSTYSSNPAAKGTVTPRGGSSWADAWLTITTGATASRIAAGDTIKIAKSPDPVAVTGTTASWTNLSKTVTLNTANTITVDNCETAYTAANSAVITRTAAATDGKEGSYCMKIALPGSGIVVSRLYAYVATGTLNLSTKQELTFWIKNSAALLNDQWNIVLCSDVAGATPVDTFVIPVIGSTTAWTSLNLTRTGGGTLGGSIKSIAIYTGANATVPAISTFIIVDNFSASATNGLNLNTLISRNSAAVGGNEAWYSLKSISGTTLLIDNHTTCKVSDGRGYTGVTNANANTYFRQGIPQAIGNSSVLQQVQLAGTDISPITYAGGYDTSDATGATRNGETFLNGRNGSSTCYYMTLSYNEFKYLSAFRMGTCFYFSGITSGNINSVSSICSNGTGVSFYQSSGCKLSDINNINNNNNAISANFINTTIKNVTNIIGNGIGVSTGALYIAGSFNSSIDGVIFDNNYAQIYTYPAAGALNGDLLFYNCIFRNATNPTIKTDTSNITYVTLKGANNTFSDASYLSSAPSFCSPFPVISMSNFTDQTATLYSFYQLGFYFIISAESSIVHGSATKSWKISPTSATYYGRNNPLELKLAHIACKASKLVTVTAWFRRTNTGITASLTCKQGQLTALTIDYTQAMTVNADTWEQRTITFTPSQAGVVEIVAQVYGGTTYSVYVSDMTISQAD